MSALQTEEKSRRNRRGSASVSCSRSSRSRGEIEQDRNVCHARGRQSSSSPMWRDPTKACRYRLTCTQSDQIRLRLEFSNLGLRFVIGFGSYLLPVDVGYIDNAIVVWLLLLINLNVIIRLLKDSNQAREDAR